MAVSKSTKELFKLHGWKNLHQFFHGYLYLARLRQYVLFLAWWAKFYFRHFPQIGRLLGNFMSARYHSKVLRHEDARKFVSLNVDVMADPSTCERIIPYRMANQIVLTNPESITVVDCACRLASKKGCVPIAVCLMIGEPQATFVLEHCKDLHARRITSEEALDILKVVHDRGWVHTIWMKDAVGGRTYAMCNCCNCCCFGLSIGVLKLGKMRNGLAPMLPSGYAARIDAEKCTGCGICKKVCPFEACRLDANTKKAAVIHEECFGCGVCVDKCKAGAMALVRDPAKGVPLDLDELT